jgi:manganese transport protein
MWQLPTTATAPFCPSEVQGTVPIPRHASLWRKILLYCGPGLLISVGYMDPGNWATDIEAGAKYGYALLFVVLLSSAAAIFVQLLSMRVGLVTRHDLAQLCRSRYLPLTNSVLWIMAELAIVMTDIAEVLGAGLAFTLLFGCSLKVGMLLTVLDTFIVLGLQGKGFRRIEAIILGLILTIGLCYFVELFLVGPHWPDVFRGFVPHAAELPGIEPWYLAVGIFGATVMPHNLYLHSSVVHTRDFSKNPAATREAIRYNSLDTGVSLFLAFIVNSAILILAGAAFFVTGHHEVASIDNAYHLLEPLVGGTLASFLFGLALLAAGQSSTFTGTIAGQIVMEGFMDWKIPCWQRRFITRGLALFPAFIGVLYLGEHSVGQLLVFTQVVLSLLLPLTIFPLIVFASDAKLMGEFKLSYGMTITSWLLFIFICATDLVLLTQLFI